MQHFAHELRVKQPCHMTRFLVIFTSQAKIYILKRASRSALMKYIINSLIYLSTTNIYWSIQATCFDLLTGHLQASSTISLRCCLDIGIQYFYSCSMDNDERLYHTSRTALSESTVTTISSEHSKGDKTCPKCQITTHVLTRFNYTLYVPHSIQYQILCMFTTVKILGSQHLNSSWDLFCWRSDVDLLTGWNM